MPYTAEHRRSASGVPFLPLGVGLTPNGLKDSQWRRQSAWSYSGVVQGREGGGAFYPTEAELKAFVEQETKYQEEKTRQREKRIRDNEELQNTIEIALLKAKGLWVEPQPELEIPLPPELAEIPFKPFDPRLLAELTNLRTMDEDDVEILLLDA